MDVQMCACLKFKEEVQVEDTWLKAISVQVVLEPITQRHHLSFCI